MQKIFDEIYSDGKNIYTKNMLAGKKVYGERLIKEGGTEYREWDPYRSKYCAAIKKGLTENIFKEKETVLYLGSAEGTTVSHVSDIVGKNGAVFCVDISEIAMQKLSKLAEERENLYPILSDAQLVENYEEYFKEKADSMFMDVSQRNQADIFVRNSKLLKKGGLAALSLKTKSISQAEKKEDVLEKEKKLLEKEFEILQIISIEPYEKEHYLIVCKKK
jgi:fibrillarin-like pre-rRNA processing protein